MASGPPRSARVRWLGGLDLALVCRLADAPACHRGTSQPFYELTFRTRTSRRSGVWLSTNLGTACPTISLMHRSHLLASGSNDHCVRWWSRPRPGVQTVGLPRARDAGAPEDIDDDDGSLPGLAHANTGRGRGQAPSRAATSSNRAPLPARGPYSRPDNLARPPNGIPGFGAPAARGAADPHAAASNWRDRVMALQQQTSAPPGSGWR